MTLQDALHLAEQTGQPQTFDWPEGGIRIRARINEYGERQLALAAAGGVSESQGVAIAVAAGFGGWSTDRSGKALVLTEIEAGDVLDLGDDVPPWEDRAAPLPAQTAPHAQPVDAGPFRPGLPLIANTRPKAGLLHHGYTNGGHLFTVLTYSRNGATGWRCDALEACVTETDNRSWSDFQAWLSSV